MYNQYFGLNENPFSIAPNPKFLFMSKRHKEALAHLLYGVSEGGGFVMLTGEVGTGKTTICRCLLEQIPKSCELAFVLNPKLSAIELLATICDELQIEYDKSMGSMKVLMDALSKYLIEKHQAGKRVVLMIDEAQNLSAEVLEQVRLLTNLETNTEKLLQIILIGQPELKTLLSQRVLRQLAQRVTARYHLEPLTEHDLDDYVSHRLAIAGQRNNPFTQDAIKYLHTVSGGIPRLVNSVCDRALLGAYVLNRKVIDAKIIRKAAKEVLGDQARELASNPSKDNLGAGLSFESGGIYISKPAFFGGIGAVMTLMLAVIVWQFSVMQPSASLPQETAEKRVLSPSVAPSKTVSQAEAEALETIKSGAVVGDSGMMPQTLASSETGLIEAALPAQSAEPTRQPLSHEPAISEAALLQSLWAGQPWVREPSFAHKPLFATWSVSYNPLEHGAPCAFAMSQSLKCESGYGSWNDLIALNRPALLKFMTAGRGHFYGILLKVVRDTGGVKGEFQFGSVRKVVPLEQVNSLWSGDYTLLWRMPPGYTRPVGRGSKGKIVTWLSEKLAAISGAATYEAFTEYNSSLAEKVRQFQQANNLVPDGIAGAQKMIVVK